MRYALHGVRGARQDPAAATCTPQPVAWWLRLARGWAWAVAGGAAVVVALRVPAVWTDERGLLAHGVRLPWVGGAAAWQAGQYRRRGADRTAGVWAVLAGGFAAAAGAVIVYRVARYWVPGAAGAVAAATLTRRHPAPPTARPVTSVSKQTSPLGNALATAGQPHGPGHAALPSPPAVPARQDGRRV